MMPSWITQTPETGVTADSFLKSVVVSIVYLVCFLFLPSLSIHATDDSNTLILVAFDMPIGKCSVSGILLVIQQTKFYVSIENRRWIKKTILHL
jgi:hypothetical protein